MSDPTNSDLEHDDYPTLVLKPHQTKHFQKVMDIVSKFYFYVDGSEQSTGKTYIATAVAITLNLPVVVICPVIAKSVWQEVLTTYGVPVYDLPETGGIITYETLRSMKNRQPKHGLLIREDGKTGVKFYASDDLNQIVQSGVLFIFDECQKLKNMSTQNKAAKALVQSLYENGGHSRAAFLSGTPMDKDEQILNFLRLSGFYTRRNLYTKVRGEIREDGIAELKNWAEMINPEALTNFIQNNNLRGTKQGAVKYVNKLFLSVIRPGIMSIMPNELNKMKDIKNGYYVMDPQDEQDYHEAIKRLSKAAGYNPIKESVYVNGLNMGDINGCLIDIQMAKTNALIRVCREILDEEKYTPNGDRIYPKVVLFSFYHDIFDKLMGELAEYNPVEVSGRIQNQNRRVENIKSFQEPNPKTRVFVGSLISAGQAVNLHDTTGLYPRTTFIMPDYRVNEIVQAAARTTRPGIVEMTKVRLFYGLTGITENKIIKALSKKGKHMRKITIEQTESGAIFPDQYENDYEKVRGEEEVKE